MDRLQDIACRQLQRDAASQDAILAVKSRTLFDETLLREIETFDPRKMELVADKDYFVFARKKIRVRVQGYRIDMYLPRTATVADAFVLGGQFLREHDPEAYARGYRVMTRVGMKPSGRGGTKYEADGSLFYDPEDHRALLPHLAHRRVHVKSDFVTVEPRNSRESKAGYYIPGKPVTARVRFKTAREDDFTKFDQKTLRYVVDNAFYEASALYGDQLFAARVLLDRRDYLGYYASKPTSIKFARAMQKYLPDDAHLLL